MQSYMQLYKERNNDYYSIVTIPKTDLRFLRGYFETDYRSYDEDYLFSSVLSSYNEYFVYHDKINHLLYIGWALWDVDEDVEFPNYFNDSNSCKINVENFKAFIIQWKQLKKNSTPFALIYRDDSEWIDCKGFNTQEEMELFIKNFQHEVVH